MKRPNILIVIALVGVWSLSLWGLFSSTQSRIEADLETVVEQRAESIRQQVDIARAVVEQLRRQMQANLDVAQPGAHPSRGYIRQLAQQDVYGADGLEAQVAGRPLLNASLTGVGDLSDLDTNTSKEINAALALVLSNGGEISDDPEFVWVYYTSANRFIYVYPKVAVTDYAFNEELYQKPFWVIATPEANPQRRVVISEAYEDDAGQGLMFTVSGPVYSDDLFRGVVSIDLGLNRLRKSLSIGGIDGDSVLIDRSGHIYAAPFDFKLGQRLDNFIDASSMPSSFSVNENTENYLVPVIPDQLYVVHQIDHSDKVLEVLLSMSVPALVVTLLVGMLFLALLLRSALSRSNELAIRDGLTGLYNRRGLFEHITHILDYADRSGIELSLLMIDIDRFKQVNDTYGHSAGDKALKLLAKSLNAECRRSDLIARYGGEEFVVVLPDADFDEAMSLAERIRHAIELDRIGEEGFRITVSIGCTQRLGQQSYESMLKNADEALYAAKNAGRNQVVNSATLVDGAKISPVERSQS